MGRPMPVAVPHSPSSVRRTRRPDASAKSRAAQQETERRHALVAAAERVFLKRGYHAATMDDIAAAAGMSKRTLYQLVKSKEQLFLMLLDRHRPQVSVTVDHSGPPAAMLFEIMAPWARQLLAPPNVSLLRLIIADYQRGRTLARLLDRSSAQLCKDLLADYLGELTSMGKLALADAAEAAQMLYGMAIGNIHFGMLIGRRGAPSRDEIEGRLRRAIDIFLCGAKPHSEAASAGPEQAGRPGGPQTEGPSA